MDEKKILGFFGCAWALGLLMIAGFWGTIFYLAYLLIAKI